MGKIEPPFANYNPANLERLVVEGFEEIERNAYDMNENATSWGTPSGHPIDPFDFQVLVAADFYLRMTKNDDR